MFLKNFPIIQEILTYGGTIFLIYLAYKISFSKTSSGSTSENPVKFIETFFFSIFESKRSYCSDNNCFNLCRKWKTLYKLFFMGNCRCIFFCMCKYYFWTLLGKFLSKFATNEKFIKLFNYVMSILLLGCIATFYY